MKLGSLFDGSGGFPLAGFLCGIEPVWASEVEPYPIAVTKTRFPNMKHLGDISKINGAEIEPVDIITFGSPCQDLSVAGKRAGLKHEDNGDDETTRSGLFMEAVRIIKEMREKTNGEYPRFAVWENVPGAFSSNKGEDFRIVLEELVKIVEPTAVMPAVPQFGWAYADSYCGDGWSLAYRVFDAQYWGVPQRRRRIYLVADFGGQCAREILFEREGLRGYFTEGRTPWQTTPADAERSVGADDREGEIPYTLKIRSGVSVDSYGKAAGKGALIQKNLSATLGVSQDQYLFQPTAYGISAYESNSMKSSNPHSGVYEAETSRTIDLNGGNPACNQGGIAVVENVVLDDQGGSQISVRHDGKSPTLRAEMHGNVPCVMESAGFCTEHSAKSRSIGFEEEVSPTLRAGVTPACVYSVENHPADSRVNLDESGKVQCLTSRMGTGGGNVPMVMEKVPRVINLNKDDVQSKAILDPKGIAPALYAGECRGGGGECYVMEQKVYECHSQDLRVKEIEDGVSPTISAGMGMGGANMTTPMLIQEPFCKSRRAQTADDATTWKHGKVANTLNTFDLGETRANELVVETVALEGNGQRPSHRGDGYAVTDKSYTLNSTEVHGVAYAVDQGGGKSACNVTEEKAPTLTTTHDGAPAVAYSFDPGASRDVGVLFIEECGKTLTNGTCPGHHDGVVISQPVLTASKASFFMNTDEELASTLVATDYKDPQLVAFDTSKNKYIVRRLTPTECARLQGFADRWGDIELKTEFSDEEYRFWHDVRNTHAAINGKAVKEYTKAQILTWYNKLHTDSAEYKLWGNGIALPTALYVIQGIADTTKE